MTKILEIEIRYSVNENSIINTIEKILNLGFKKKEDIKQEDIYYTSKYVDFIKSEECLRIRTVGERSEITWKPASNIEMKESNFFWKEEIDLDINNQVDIAKSLFNRLGFIEYCTVSKDRVTYLNNGNIEVSLDKIKEVGCFLEIEMKSDKIEMAKREINFLVEKLGLKSSHICKIPYRDLVVQGYNNLGK